MRKRPSQWVIKVWLKMRSGGANRCSSTRQIATELESSYFSAIHKGGLRKQTEHLIPYKHIGKLVSGI